MALKLISERPTALYVYHAAHSLNWALSDSCHLPSIRKCTGTVASVYYFFNVPKLQNLLKSAINTSPATTISKKLVLC